MEALLNLNQQYYVFNNIRGSDRQIKQLKQNYLFDLLVLHAYINLHILPSCVRLTLYNNLLEKIKRLFKKIDVFFIYVYFATIAWCPSDTNIIHHEPKLCFKIMRIDTLNNLKHRLMLIYYLLLSANGKLHEWCYDENSATIRELYCTVKPR